MMSTSHPGNPGMGPGHPMAAHGYPMQVQHPHMGQPNPVMMAGMHPGMSGPQVTSGPMASMAPNPGTPAPGPMGNAMAMAHLGGQAHMFQGNPQQMNTMQMNSIMAQRRAMGMPMQGGQMQQMTPQNMQQMAQLQKMTMGGMPMHGAPQHMTQAQQTMAHNASNWQHQQRMMAQHANQQQQFMQRQQQQAHAQQQQQQQQQHVSQQMQMSRSNEAVTQPPQQQPTPAPQTQPTPQPQPQPQPNTPAPQQTPQARQPQTQATPAQQQSNSNAPTPQIKQGDDDDAQGKQDIKPQQMMMDMPASVQDFHGQCLLQLLSYYDTLANPDRPDDLEYWRTFTARYYAPDSSLNQQLRDTVRGQERTYRVAFDNLPRFYHSHFANGVRRMYMQSFNNNLEQLPHGGHHVYSDQLIITYEYNDDVRIVMSGSLSVTFDDVQRISHMAMMCTGWNEYMPRRLAETALSPEMARQSPKLTKKSLAKNLQQRQNTLPRSPVCNQGIPVQLLQFLEIAEITALMGPLVSYCKDNQIPRPGEALIRYNQELSNRQQQQMNGIQMNNMQFAASQRMANMQPPTHFQSPGLQHLNLPQNTQSPHMNHTPSPNHPGGVQMVHQMSAQGSNMSGSQGASTNTSPNVTNKRRRASAIKEEDAAQAVGGDRTKPSPRTNKRQKPT